MHKKEGGRENYIILIPLVLLLLLILVLSLNIPGKTTGNATWWKTLTCVSITNGVKVVDSAGATAAGPYLNTCSGSSLTTYTCGKSTGNIWDVMFKTFVKTTTTTCQYGCNSTTPTCNAAPACIDNDRDGYGQNCANGPDCNDANAAINPGVTESCSDTIDNDCDGIANDGCPVCGNTLKETGEECDGTDLAGATCQSLGYTGGTLSCSSSCTYNKAACTTVIPPACPDGTCNGAETSITCPQDCPETPAPVNYTTMRLYYQGEGFKHHTTAVKDYNYVATTFTMINTGATLSDIQQIKSVNPNIKVLRYIKFAGVKGLNATSQCCRINADGTNNCPSSGTLEYTLMQDAAQNNLFWYKTGTSSKVLGKASNPPPTGNNGWCFIDIINTTKRTQWVTAMVRNANQAEMANNSYVNGIFLDNAQIPQSGYIGILLPNGSYDPLYYDIYGDGLSTQWYNGAVQAVNGMRTSLPSKYILLNGYTNDDAAGDNRGLQLLDAGGNGLLRENFAFKYGVSKYWPRYRLMRAINDSYSIVNGIGLQNSQSRNFVQMDYIDKATNTEARIYSLAAYLLYANQNAYWSPVALDTSGSYPSHAPELPEYYLDLGAPKGKYVDNATTGLVTRDYEKGIVVFNADGMDSNGNQEGPVSRDYTVSCSTCTYSKLVLNGGGFHGDTMSLSWTPVALTNGKITVPRHTAIIIKNN